jgi:endoglucanase
MVDRREVLAGMSGLLVARPSPPDPLIRAVAMSGPLPDDQWLLWRSRFLSSDGRVVDTANGGVSHSEGQGYGLLLAASMRDAPLFERIWRWTEANLGIRDDGLFAWRWDPRVPGDPVADRNAALDGDLLIAWALIRAGALWSKRALIERAVTIAQAIRAVGIVDHAGMPILLPGPAGFVRPEGPVVNLSYWVFPALRTLARLERQPVWDALIASGRHWLEQLRFGTYRLPPDWALLADHPVPAPGFPAEFGYNAIRIPLHLAWGEPDADALLRPFADFWDRVGRVPPTLVALDGGGAMRTGGATLAIQALHALVTARLTGTAPAFPALDAATEYFPATLVLLARLAFEEV